MQGRFLAYHDTVCNRLKKRTTDITARSAGSLLPLISLVLSIKMALTVACNELTWAIRHANVAYTATVKSDGMAIISYHLTDRFDLTPGGSSPAYNCITNVAGFIYHTLAGDNRNLQVSADWQTTIK